jgi:hypothetical protein
MKKIRTKEDIIKAIDTLSVQHLRDALRHILRHCSSTSKSTLCDLNLDAIPEAMFSAGINRGADIDPGSTKYAHIAWTVNDIKTLRPRWSLKRCEAFLAENEKYIQERLIELGWEVLDTLIFDTVLP